MIMDDFVKWVGDGRGNYVDMAGVVADSTPAPVGSALRLALADGLWHHRPGMTPQNPRYADRVRHIFEAAPFVQHLGIQLVHCEPGRCETRMKIESWQLQQTGVVHAGVQATLADHTAGGAAGTLIAADQLVVSIEFKINLLRPATGDELRCRAVVLRPGTQISVVESEVFAVRGGEERLTAKAMVTLAVVA